MINNRTTTTTNDLLYSEKDLEDSMDRIDVIHFHQEHEVSNIRFTCYHAGHVLGAAMFSFDIAGVQVKTIMKSLFIILAFIYRRFFKR